MADQQVISYADLSIINNALNSMRSNIIDINDNVGEIHAKQDLFETELDKLANAFYDFVEDDRKHKALQLAETRVGNLKQDLQIKFGYYAEIRRMATGILQSVDTGVVSDDTLRFTTEEVMLKAPGYWLASSLVSVAAWIRNDKSSSEKALNESLKRDDYKTTLFFMLVMRRLSRHEASVKWLERYFMHQNPHNLDREFIIILEAVTTGVFSPASRSLMMRNVKNWLVQLSQTDNFINEQKQQWIKFFEASGPLYNHTYPLLEQYATNFDSLKLSLKQAKTYQVMQGHFGNILQSSSDLSKAVKVQLDEILSMLVTNFDDEELPLQKQVRLNQLIIEMDGDKNAAQAKMDAEEYIFEEKVDFLQMLTNAAFNPELAGATKATQALAVSISQPWIIEAHDTFTAQNRSKIPNTVELSIDGFNTATKDGADENEQLQSQDTFYEYVLKNELEKISFPYAMVIIGSLISLIGIIAFFNGAFPSEEEAIRRVMDGESSPTGTIIISCIIAAIGGIMIWNSLNKQKKRKESVKEAIEERHTKAREVLRGCIAETVDYRKEHQAEDNKSEKLREMLMAITPEDFSSVSRETARSIV